MSPTLLESVVTVIVIALAWLIALMISPRLLAWFIAFWRTPKPPVDPDSFPNEKNVTPPGAIPPSQKQHGPVRK